MSCSQWKTCTLTSWHQGFVSQLFIPENKEVLRQSPRDWLISHFWCNWELICIRIFGNPQHSSMCNFHMWFHMQWLYHRRQLGSRHGLVAWFYTTTHWGRRTPTLKWEGPAKQYAYSYGGFYIYKAPTENKSIPLLQKCGQSMIVKLSSQNFYFENKFRFDDQYWTKFSS